MLSLKKVFFLWCSCFCVCLDHISQVASETTVCVIRRRACREGFPPGSPFARPCVWCFKVPIVCQRYARVLSPEMERSREFYSSIVRRMSCPVPSCPVPCILWYVLAVCEACTETRRLSALLFPWRRVTSRTESICTTARGTVAFFAYWLVAVSFRCRCSFTCVYEYTISITVKVNCIATVSRLTSLFKNQKK